MINLNFIIRRRAGNEKGLNQAGFRALRRRRERRPPKPVLALPNLEQLKAAADRRRRMLGFEGRPNRHNSHAGIRRSSGGHRSPCSPAGATVHAHTCRVPPAPVRQVSPQGIRRDLIRGFPVRTRSLITALSRSSGCAGCSGLPCRPMFQGSRKPLLSVAARFAAHSEPRPRGAAGAEYVTVIPNWGTQGPRKNNFTATDVAQTHSLPGAPPTPRDAL